MIELLLSFALCALGLSISVKCQSILFLFFFIFFDLTFKFYTQPLRQINNDNNIIKNVRNNNEHQKQPNHLVEFWLLIYFFAWFILWNVTRHITGKNKHLEYPDSLAVFSEQTSWHTWSIFQIHKFWHLIYDRVLFGSRKTAEKAEGQWFLQNLLL